MWYFSFHRASYRLIHYVNGKVFSVSSYLIFRTELNIEHQEFFLYESMASSLNILLHVPSQLRYQEKHTRLTALFPGLPG